MDAAVRAVGHGPETLPPPNAVLPLGRALRRFSLDLLIVAGLFALLSLLGALAWGVWRGVELAFQGMPTDPKAIMQAVGSPGPLATIALSVISVGGTAVLAMLWRAPPKAAERIAARASLRSPTTWVLAVFTGAAAITCSLIVAQIAAAMQETLDPSNMSLVRGTLHQYPLLLLVFAVVAAPVYEEILFRRVLFRRLWRDGWPMLGAVLSGILFAFMHEPPFVGGKPLAAQLPLWLVYTCMGLAFAWVYRRTNSLGASIAAHSLNNAFAIGVMMLSGVAN
ncbi:CPBP family intramembrane glutamic endopeptidase [Pseudoxanthomonas sp.]|uniref:CPBP family intramembrane glutamic endopeptidase n=1 Tax=Pseudoxanthomonas sp. TaxID=1871049 RepID=UPI0026186DD9|nr:CPBP family intramembrane glutamic endopeptidase [Pseudoxanthomonas sp.]WDS35171.1 MAG: CPBP family intramembrane metalloprotease [Pseudoxanthomonas sp.]